MLIINFIIGLLPNVQYLSDEAKKIILLFSKFLKSYFQLKPPLSQVKVEKKDTKFQFLANFVHTTRSKCYCNTIIPSLLSNVIEF